eukprot:1612930-Rhodomonas_salina.6
MSGADIGCVSMSCPVLRRLCCYAMSRTGKGHAVYGTDRGYAATSIWGVKFQDKLYFESGMRLRACHAMSGTDLAYGEQ